MAHGFIISGIESKQLTTRPGKGAELLVDGKAIK